jgi:hypothetical protein
MKIIFNNRKVDQWGNTFHIERHTEDVTSEAGYGVVCSQPMINEVDYFVNEKGDLIINVKTQICLDHPHKGAYIVNEEDSSADSNAVGEKGRTYLSSEREEEVHNQS